MQRNDTCKWSSIIRCSSNTKQAKRNKRIQCNNICRWHCNLWS
nr:hypothetical protein [Staphylococcus schweitzeri]